MPTFWLQPNSSPLGACRSSSSVSGSAPAGPWALAVGSRSEASTSNRDNRSTFRIIGRISVVAARGVIFPGFLREGLEILLRGKGVARDDKASRPAVHQKQVVLGLPDMKNHGPAEGCRRLTGSTDDAVRSQFAAQAFCLAAGAICLIELRDRTKGCPLDEQPKEGSNHLKPDHRRHGDRGRI